MWTSGETNTPVLVRIACRPEPWFEEVGDAMAKARGVGVPTREVLGVEQVDHNGEQLLFPIQPLRPGRSPTATMRKVELASHPERAAIRRQRSCRMPVTSG